MEANATRCQRVAGAEVDWTDGQLAGRTASREAFIRRNVRCYIVDFEDGT